MKRTWFALIAALLLLPTSGCLAHRACPQAGPCGPGETGQCQGLLGGLFGGKVCQGLYENRGWRHHQPETGPQGPPTGATAYPYYTLHGPRDFLVNNPPSLGR